MLHVEGGVSLSYKALSFLKEKVPFSKKLASLLPKQGRMDAGYRKDVEYRFTEDHLYHFWI